MNTFYDFMTIDPLQWGLETDPIGLLTYQAHKRKHRFYTESLVEGNCGRKGDIAYETAKTIDFEKVMHKRMTQDAFDKKWKVGKYDVSKATDKKDKLKEESIDEALTLQQRTRRKIIMRRLAPKLARARKIAMSRHGGNDVMKRRAKSLARNTMAKKLLGGRNKKDVSPSERARVERILATRKTSVSRLATRLVSVVRKKQALRFAAKAKPKHTSPSSSSSKPAEHKPAHKKPSTIFKPAPSPSQVKPNK